MILNKTNNIPKIRADHSITFEIGIIFIINHKF